MRKDTTYRANPFWNSQKRRRDILPTPTAGSTERASRFIGEPTQEPSTSRHGMSYRVVAPDSGKSRFVQLLLSYTM